MKRGFKVFDADAHVIYPADLWPRFLDDEVRRPRRPQAPSGLRPLQPGHGRRPAGRSTPRRSYGQFQKAINWTTEDMISQYGDDGRPRASRGDRVAQALEVEGVDVMVDLRPRVRHVARGHRPRAAGRRWRARTTAGARRCARRRAAGCITCGPDPAERRRAARSRRSSTRTTTSASAASGLDPNQFNRRNLGDRYYDPMYELLQDLDCAFATHEFMGLNAPTAGVERFDTFTEWHTVVHSHEAQYALLSMIVQRRVRALPAPARARTWRPAAGGCRRGCTASTSTSSWPARSEFPELTMNATDYFRRNCWISTECEDPFVADVIRWLGDDHIVYETDFPHPDSKYPHATEHFLDLLPDQISDESKRKILLGQRGRPLPLPRRATCRTSPRSSSTPRTRCPRDGTRHASHLGRLPHQRAAARVRPRAGRSYATARRR